MPLTTTALRSVMRQIQEIEANPVDGIALMPSDNLSEIHFELDGPVGTPFAAGRFHVVLCFDEEYPSVPPKGYFKTKIFHPNISEKGEICVNALKRDWNADLGLRHILLVIRCLLVEPNPESALNDEAGRLILEDFASFERKAQMYTSIHALRPVDATRHNSVSNDEHKETLSAEMGKPPLQSKHTCNAASHDANGNAAVSAENDKLHLHTIAPNNSTTVGTKPTKKPIDKKKNALRRIEQHSIKS